MADYYPLIARAVAFLDHSTGEGRHSIYERARTALVNQLRSVDPQLNNSYISGELLTLDAAIRKVEAEATKRPRADAADEARHRSLRRLDNFNEPSAADEPIQPAHSYDRLIKIALFLLIVAGVAGAAYWQTNSLMASFRTNTEMDMWDLAAPIVAYGGVAFIFLMCF